MELALYDPAGGYYRGETARPGRGGDFLTAPETHPVFGEMLARALAEIWERLGRPEPFVLREYGAGTGALASSVLAGLELDRSPLAGVLRYDPVEVEPRRLEAIATRFRNGGRSSAVLDAGARTRPIEGVVFANEVLDALPTHRVVGRDGRPSGGVRRLPRGTPSSTSKACRPRPRWRLDWRPTGSRSPTGSAAKSAWRSSRGWPRPRPDSGAGSCC